MLPDNWRLAPLSSLASVERGKFSVRPRNDPRYFGGNVPFVQTGDVANAGMFLRSYSQTLNERGVSISRVFPTDTILLTIAANIGATAITTFPVACPDSVVGIRPHAEKIDVLWLKYALVGQQTNLDAQASQNAQKNINLEVLNPLQLRVPPFSEQQRIGKLLVCWDQSIATTERLLANSRKQKQILAHQVLTGKRRIDRFRTQQYQTTPHGPIPKDWSYRQIQEVAEEVSTKLGSGAPYPVCHAPSTMVWLTHSATSTNRCSV